MGTTTPPRSCSFPLFNRNVTPHAGIALPFCLPNHAPPAAAPAAARGSSIFRLALATHCPDSSCMGVLSSGPRVLAVLGPTNTGKTHLAIERMLGHQSGMIGFPLRLLARENYDRVVRLRGARSVALITGEEKI